MFNLLYSPTLWSQHVNVDLYQFTLLVLRAAQAHNVTVPGGNKYNVPPGVSTTDKTLLSQIGAALAPPYSVVEIGRAHV